MKYIQSIRRLLAFLRPMQLSLHSGYTTFFLVLSLFPSMPLLLGLLKYTDLQAQDLLTLVGGLLPQGLMPLAQWLVDTSYRHSSALSLSLSALAALWSASRGMQGLRRGLSAVQGTPERLGFFHSRLVSMGCTLLFLLALVLTVVLHVSARGLLDFLQMTTRPELLLILRSLDVQGLVVLLLLTGLFTCLYAWIPARRSRLLYSLPGGTLVALALTALARLFSVYVQYFSGYSSIFGSLYTLALGLLWLYFCVSLVFYSAVVNRIIFEKTWQK